MLEMMKKETFDSTTGCDCLPLCKDVTYNWEISQAQADFQDFYAAHNLMYRKDPE